MESIDNLNKVANLRNDMISYLVNLKTTSQMSDKQYDALEKRISQKSFAQLKKEYDILKKNKMANGGGIERENAEMVLNNNKQISHHTKELASAVKGKKVPAWVVAKVNRSASDLSDATHYLDGSKFKNGGGVGENSKIAEFHKNFADGGKNTKIKSWYIKTYPQSKRAKYIDIYSTFEDLWNAIENNLNVYGIIGDKDSQIRETLFEKLSQIKGVKYKYIYNKWLDSDEDKYAKGGYVFKGDKYEYVPTKFIYTIGGL